MRRITKVGVLVIIVLLAAGIIGYLVWTSNPYQPMPEALEALKSDARVQVETDGWLIFRSRTSEPTIGFIFYPGALIDARAYAPAAHAIASSGYLVVIVPMPFNLALFDSNRAAQVIAKFPSIRRWAIGGHSLGGVAAAMFVKNHPDTVGAIAFWASYPADSLSDTRVAAASIYGTNDGSVDQLLKARSLMPPLTRWVAIDGGNHGQFGYYGLQAGDGTATITREEQQRQIVSATVELLSRIED